MVKLWAFILKSNVTRLYMLAFGMFLLAVTFLYMLFIANADFHYQGNCAHEIMKGAYEKFLEAYRKLEHSFSNSSYSFSTISSIREQKKYVINWYSILPDLTLKLNDGVKIKFDKCKYSNCQLTFGSDQSNISDAVLFDGRSVSETLPFTRPFGQVWIFTADESVESFEDTGGHWLKPQWRNSFNWTMTYDKYNTDIFMPYGELLKKSNMDIRNFTAIAQLKIQSAVMINSHCPCRSKRELFVEKLKQYIPIEVLGSCGKPWNCGTHYVHDDCFKLLNTTYKFFLAFENALCRQYFTEKIYDNYNYDVIPIVRGGSYRETQSLFPEGSIISTDDFASVDLLGRYLQRVSGSTEEYKQLLEKHSQYYSPGYSDVYQRAMCDVCDRLNNIEKYRKEIKDIREWAYGCNPCRKPNDM